MNTTNPESFTCGRCGHALQQWQPIATAPRDGTWIDLWLREFSIGPAGRITAKDDGRRTDCRWGNSYYCYRSGDGFKHDYGETQEWVIQEDGNTISVETEWLRATHWMPLPPPPAE